MSKVVAIVSGGMDSVTLLKKLLVDGHEVLVLNFSYGSKHNSKERRSLLDACDQLNVPVYMYDLPTEADQYIPNSSNDHRRVPLLESDLLKTGGSIPEGHYAEPTMKQTVVPFRNGIMLALAVGFAESHGCTAVFYGNHAGDHAVYPDCRPFFVEAMSGAAQYGTYEGVQIISPFKDMTKADIARLGLKIGVPYENTWTCYKGGDRPCLVCSTCVERIQAFYEAGVKDPALTDEEWDRGVENMLRVVREFDEQHKDDIKAAQDYEQEQGELHG